MSSVLFVNSALPTVDHDSALSYVLVEHGRIASLGPMTDARGLNYSGDIRDLEGAALLPGFVDAHAHVVEAGVERLRCDMSGCQSREDVIARVASARKAAGSEWIVGRGWELGHFQTQPPSLREIDGLTGGNPTYLNNANGHCAWVNSAALSLAGVTAETPDPPGGKFGRDPQGALTGMLYESAMNVVNDIIPSLGAVDLEKGLIAGQKELHSFGVTSWQEAIVGPYVQTTDVFNTLSDAEANGQLTSRVEGALWWPRGGEMNYIEHLASVRDSRATASRFRCNTIKIMYDGSAATQTAAMKTAYRSGGNGLTFFTADELSAIVIVADRAGFNVHIHANGDRAVSEALDAIEDAQRTNPERARRHQLAHLHFVTRHDVERMSRLKVVAVVQPLWAHMSTKMKDLTLPMISEQQRGRIYPFGSLEAAGVQLASSSDWPVSSPNPLDAIHVAVNRSNSHSVGDEALSPAEALTMRSALRAATEGAAFALGRSAEIGAISPGFAADLVILDRPLFGAEAGIDSAQVETTFIDGKVVFER